MKFPIRFLTVILATLLAIMSRADVIVDTSLSGSPGAYVYSYEIDNQTAIGIFSFSLSVTGDIEDIQSPSGWVQGTATFLPGQTLVQWIDLDVPYDVPAFGVLPGFLIMSDSGPGIASFSALDENFSEFDGETTGPVAMIDSGPAAVPEPNSLILIVSGVIGVIVRRPWLRSVGVNCTVCRRSKVGTEPLSF